MSLLSYNELVKLVEDGVITADLANINGSSIDITLDDVIMIEQRSKHTIDLAKKENIGLMKFDISDSYVLDPDEFILASSVEVFNLPADISAEYKLKSSMARNGLDHANAGWCDAHWHGSRLTLELKNISQYHRLKLTPNMKIGQMVFFRHEPVAVKDGYAVKGQYNQQKEVQQSKGIR